MESFLTSNPELIAQLLTLAFKLVVVIFGIICSAFALLFGIVGYFVKKEIKTLNESVVELFRELRTVIQKTGTYDQVVAEHNINHAPQRRTSDQGEHQC